MDINLGCQLKKKLLYIAPHRPGRSPGQRFRFEQYQDFLEEKGFEITYSFIVNAWDDRILYSKGRYCLKLWIALKAIIIRLYDWMRCGKYDVVLIYREANFLGNIFFEKRFAASKVPVLFDFDDAIWLNDVSDGNKNLKWLKRPEKTAEIVALSHLVIVGNQYLASYARQYNNKVTIIPTSVNTDYHKMKPYHKNGSVCIGWTGSSTTIKHFEEARPFLKQLKVKYGNKVSFKVIVDIPINDHELGFSSTIWSADSEIDELNAIDIGIMPLPDDKWSKGKCGFKGIQYMALAKPTVMSPVGVNTEIIEDGENGFLAATADEWIVKLSQLIESEELRERLGKNGQQTIVDKYSVDIQKQALLEAIESVLS